MQFDAAFFFAALALALVLEGLPWALAPGRTRESLRLLLDLPPQALRAGGRRGADRAGHSGRRAGHLFQELMECRKQLEP